LVDCLRSHSARTILGESVRQESVGIFRKHQIPIGGQCRSDATTSRRQTAIYWSLVGPTGVVGMDAARQPDVATREARRDWTMCAIVPNYRKHINKWSVLMIEIREKCLRGDKRAKIALHRAGTRFAHSRTG
ncbi:hypothetical protein LSAT2_006650, partial [Lamellibrachia satsuma]